MERVIFINHKNKDIIIIDLSQTTTNEQQVEIVNQAEKMLNTCPFNSARSLIDYTDARCDMISVESSKNISANVAPYLKASAVLGIGGLKRTFLRCVVGIIGRNIRPFDNIETAKDWLAEQ